MEGEGFFLDSESGRVSCLLNRAGSPLAVLAHGYLSDKNSRTNTALAERLNGMGISTISFDMYGHGESGGDVERLTVTKAVQNISAIHAHARREGFAKIGLAGSSFTGMVSLIAASELDFSALALKCPLFDGRRLWDERLGPEGIAKWKSDGFISPFGKRWFHEVYEDEGRYDMRDVASRVRAPTLVIHGDRDETVPISQAKDLYASLRCEKRFAVIEGADHFFNDPPHFERMLNESSEWFRAHLLP